MITIKSVVYPEPVSNRISEARSADRGFEGNAFGTEANFSCGSFIRFSLLIDIPSSVVANAAFASNGCGYMIAAADVLAESVIGRHLGDLRGLTYDLLTGRVKTILGNIPLDRQECVAACIGSLRAAFAEFRAKQVEEFRGEDALICTCFGVSEKTIERQIAALSLETVDEVGRACNAGSGCGSCRMLIQEMIDGSL